MAIGLLRILRCRCGENREAAETRYTVIRRFTEFDRVRIEQSQPGRFRAGQLQRFFEHAIDYIANPRIRRAGFGQVLFTELLLYGTEAFRQERALGAGGCDAGVVVVTGARGVDGDEPGQGRLELGVRAVLIALEGAAIDHDTPAIAAGVFTISA